MRTRTLGSLGFAAAVLAASVGCASSLPSKSAEVGDDLSEFRLQKPLLTVDFKGFCDFSDEESSEAKKQAANHSELSKLLNDPRQCLRSKKRQDQLWNAGVPLFWGIVPQDDYVRMGVEYPRNEDSIFVLAGNGATDIDCYVATSGNVIIGSDIKDGDDCTVYFNSKVGGLHYVYLVNRGHQENRFLGHTDGEYSK